MPLSRTWAEVDLSALRHNVRIMKRRAAPARLMAVVKADAYGHGALPVARAAVEAGADALAVVTVGEGAQLREGGVEVPILVFTDLLPGDLPRARDFGLTVSAHSVESAELIAAVPGLLAHLKVNTGMNRWGVEPEEVEEAKRTLGDHLSGVYTHFASADSEEATTRDQIDLFDEVLASNDFGGALVHASNSAATLWHPAARYDCVRLGVALYGLHPAGKDPEDEGLRPVMTLGSYVASMRTLAPGDGVSYGLTFRAGRELRAATVPVGYAEGYRRTLSGRAEALIGGKRSPLLGRVTMDACVFGLDPEVAESVTLGDEVVLLGEQGEERVSAEEVGRLAGTINYEITTGIDPRRVERSYLNVQGP